MRDYGEFLASKVNRFEADGIDSSMIAECLYPFQQEITQWALRVGRSCVFADCGLGKTLIQLEWADHVCDHTGGQVLVLAPLAVASQTAREAGRFGYEAIVVDSQEDCESPICITNYEKLHHFDPSAFSGVVLDESSILKSHTGHFRNELIDRFRSHRFKLACTATPAPNDVMELGNHAEFVGAMTRSEMLSMFFIHDGGETQKWRLKGHAHDEYWRWVMSWAMVVSLPSDLGYSDEGYVLPELDFDIHEVESSAAREGQLFDVHSPTLSERRTARRASLADRCQVAADLANGSDDQWIMWCDLNDESDMLNQMIPDAVEIRGSDTNEHKRNSMLAFADGKIRVLVTKPKISGFGMNWQNCARMAFVGLSDSYEALYQATRRCWRFGQDRGVQAHIITSTGEGAVLRNVMRKEADHKDMQAQMRRLMQEFGTKPEEKTVKAAGEEWGEKWLMKNGDCVDLIREVEDESVGYSVFSPPFGSLYTYSNSPEDMGNCTTDDEFYTHFQYLAPELLRITQPGRLLSFHCMLLPTSKVRDGVIGLKDFRGDLIRIFQDAGWIYHSEVCIWKDPVTAMQRTKALGLLHKTIRKDSAMSRQGIPDYVVTMRKPGENANPIAHDRADFPVSLWQKWASPIWMDINPNDTLQFRAAREENDERHICPLQLDVIRRCIGLWTNPGDLVFSPFAGIGSEGHESLKWGRSFLGIELKRSYFDLAVQNLRATDEETRQGALFG